MIIQNVTVFRICAKPPPLLAQAQAVQWRQPGHDHGGAPGRCGDQQQQHSVGETKCFQFCRSFYAKVIFARVCVTIALCRKAGSTTNLNGSDGKDRDLKLPPGPSTTQTWPFVEVIPCPLP